MSFLAPVGLLALLALPLIVLLHMLRERRRRVVVPSLLLWQLLPQRREAQRRRRLPLTLLLLLHLLAAALLALALARPQWVLDLFARERHLVVIIDTSTSMAAPAPGIGVSRLDAARERAGTLIGQMTGLDTIALVVAGPRPYLLDSAGPEGAARLLAALGGLRAGGTGSDMSGALTLAEAALQEYADARVVVFTDGALPTLADQLAARPATLPVEWNLVGGPLDNRAVVTLAARPRGSRGPTQVYARVVNYGARSLRSVVRLYGDNELLDTRPVTLQARGEADLTWTVPTGLSTLRAEIDGGDNLPADDAASLGLAQTRPLRALLVSAQPAALERALRAVPGLELATLDPFAYSSAAATQADLTIFDSYLPENWPAGGVLVLNPPSGAALLEVSERAREPLGDEAGLRFGPLSGGELFDGISLGSVQFGPARTVTAPPWAGVLLARGEQPLVLRGRSDTSEIAIWSFDLARGNLVSRLAFPLLMVRTVRDLTPPALPANVLVGEELRVRPDPRAELIELRGPDGTTRELTIAPGEALALPLEQPGVYTLSERGAGRTLYSGQLPVNAGASVESDLSPQQLPATAPPTVAPSTTGGAERPLWPWLAAAALAVVMAEWLYLHARRQALAEG